MRERERWNVLCVALVPGRGDGWLEHGEDKNSPIREQKFNLQIGAAQRDLPVLAEFCRRSEQINKHETLRRFFGALLAISEPSLSSGHTICPKISKLSGPL